MGKHEFKSIPDGSRAQYSPLFRPLQHIREPEWESLATFHAIGSLLHRDIGEVQVALGKAVMSGGVLKPRKGIQAAVVYWDGYDGHVVGYEPENGIQVAFGHIYHNPQKGWREKEHGIPTYTPEYVVAEPFTNRGIGMAMAQLLEDYIAVNTNGKGARIVSTIAAQTPEHRSAVEKGLARMGARKQHVGERVFYERIVLKQHEYALWREKLPHIAQSTVFDIADRVRPYKPITGPVYVSSHAS